MIADTSSVESCWLPRIKEVEAGKADLQIAVPVDLDAKY
jgi:hypothetical protein